MKKLSELFEIVVNHFKKDSPERNHQEVTEVEESESHLSRSGKSRKSQFLSIHFVDFGVAIT